KVAHPLLVGMAGTVRGLVALDRGDPEAAELDARSVLTMVSPYGVLDPARIGPRSLLAAARLASGDAPMAVRLLAPVAADPLAPAMLYSRRQAIAVYAEALLVLERLDEALAAAELAETVPAVDIRSQVRSALTLARCLAAVGRSAESGGVQARAALLAHSTQQVSERRALIPSSA
ncbi:MAG TPA: hypothetical protein VFC19_35940, partial [Candidatus Limnocylindrales bacterium]|nr:hypothetical protein [Candidatus Limnocylindrales bacterium]